MRTGRLPSSRRHLPYDRLVTGDVSLIRENPVTPGPQLASYTYDDLGRRTNVSRANGQATGYSYDGLSRLTGMTHAFGYGVGDTVTSFTYNPASQIATRVNSNDSYAWPQANQDLTETPNGLNQLTAQGATTLSYDGRGNLTANGATTYGYNSLNQLTGSSLIGSSGYTYYDPLGRMLFISPTGGPSHVFDRVGGTLIGEWNVPGSDTSRR